MPYKLIELNFKRLKKKESGEEKGEGASGIEALAKRIKVELHSGEEFNIASIEEMRKNLDKIRKSKYAIIKTTSQKVAIRACREINVAVAYDTPDTAFARKIKKEESYYFLSLKKLINAETSGERIKEIKRIRETLRIMKKYRAKIIVSLEPESTFELRSGRQIFELLKALGMSDSEAKKACYENAREFLEIAEKKAKGKLIRKQCEVL